MTEPRRSTVFDYSNLRLHSDGTRVYQKSTNLRPRLAKVAVRTSRQNWIARDAGGLANIHEFKRAKKTSQDLQADEGEDINLASGTESTSPTPDDEPRIKRKDERPAKRRRFLENLDYLNKDRLGSTSTSVASNAGTESFPSEPSSVRPFLHIITFLFNNITFYFYFLRTF